MRLPIASQMPERKIRVQINAAGEFRRHFYYRLIMI